MARPSSDVQSVFDRLRPLCADRRGVQITSVTVAVARRNILRDLVAQGVAEQDIAEELRVPVTAVRRMLAWPAAAR